MRGGDVGHSTRGQLKLANNFRLDGGARGARVDQRRDLDRIWNGFALLSEKICCWLRDADAHLAHRAGALEIGKLDRKGRH